MSGLNDSIRQQAIDYCPELKLFYPSLHNPTCYGADPNPIECIRYLCTAGGLKCNKKDKDKDISTYKWVDGNYKYSGNKVEITIEVTR
jgi:hypothetical protein